VPTPGLLRRPSVTSRLSFAISSAEQGEAAAATGVEARIDEEIEEIKRYEVCDLLLGEMGIKIVRLLIVWGNRILLR